MVEWSLRDLGAMALWLSGGWRRGLQANCGQAAEIETDRPEGGKYKALGEPRSMCGDYHIFKLNVIKES